MYHITVVIHFPKRPFFPVVQTLVMMAANWHSAFNRIQSQTNTSSRQVRFGCRIRKSRMTYIR
jgi:hypothetical protein